MKILITGGAGFIGHKLTVELTTLGHSILVVDKLTDYGVIPTKEHLAITNERIQYMSGKKLRVPVIEDIASPDIAKVVERYDPNIIINLAAFSRVNLVESNPALASDSLIKGIFNLLYANTPNLKRFVQVSSSMIYSDWPEPNYKMTEDFHGFINPKNYYGALKLAGERIVEHYCKNNNVEYTIVRPSAVYGERDIMDRIVPKFLNAAHNNEPIYVNGDSSMDFTYIDDFVGGLALCATHDDAANEIFNITRGKGRKILEAAEVAKQVTNSKSQIVIKDHDEKFSRRGTCSSAKAEIKLGYNPTCDIEKGFVQTYNWLKPKL